MRKTPFGTCTPLADPETQEEKGTDASRNGKPELLEFGKRDAQSYSRDQFITGS
jgi:hypothetical protein